MHKRKHDHVGLVSGDLHKSVQFYADVLGFEVIHEANAPDGTPICFLQNGELKYEIYQPLSGAAADQTCRVDHMSYVSEDIEKDFAHFTGEGYEIVTDGIESNPNVWEKGCRYFMIKGPGGEKIEFDQIL